MYSWTMDKVKWLYGVNQVFKLRKRERETYCVEAVKGTVQISECEEDLVKTEECSLHDISCNGQWFQVSLHSNER
jgi:hypothetical protein